MFSQPEIERRRASRLQFNSRVVLAGKDADGRDFAEDTETINVSKNGASLRTSRHLILGQEVLVRTKEKDRLGKFQVVWMGKPGTPDEGVVGLEWVELSDFWGVKFPPDNWQS
jgi:hypothetical protein